MSQEVYIIGKSEEIEDILNKYAEYFSKFESLKIADSMHKLENVIPRVR